MAHRHGAEYVVGLEPRGMFVKGLNAFAEEHQLPMKVEVLTEGVHSGGASGHVPSSFRIARQLLSRLENEQTGEILIEELHTKIPEHRIKETEKLVSILGDEVIEEFPWKDNMKPATENNVEGVLRRTWRPALSIVGSDGLPPTANAGNVLRPYTTLQLSMRIPPTTDARLNISSTLFIYFKLNNCLTCFSPNPSIFKLFLLTK